LKGKYADKRRLADDAIYVERVMCDEAGGLQDQIAASFGGFNRINFSSEGYEVKPIIISPERKEKLNDNLMFFFTGYTRFSSEIQKDTKKNTGKNIETLLEMKKLVDEAEEILVDKKRNLNDFGKLLDKSWKLKRSTGDKISTSEIDKIYDKAINAGALGGKHLGAGGGGFIVFYVPKSKQKSVKNALNKLLYVPFKFENGGTEVIYYSPEQFDVEGDYDD